MIKINYLHVHAFIFFWFNEGPHTHLFTPGPALGCGGPVLALLSVDLCDVRAVFWHSQMLSLPTETLKGESQIGPEEG